MICARKGLEASDDHSNMKKVEVFTCVAYEYRKQQKATGKWDLF
jgi:hypothetical protein